MHKNVLIVVLIIESALVLAGLLLKQDVWAGIVCYWTVLLMKNISDLYDGGQSGTGNRRGDAGTEDD